MTSDRDLIAAGIHEDKLGAAKGILFVVKLAVLAGICYALWWAF